MAEEEKKEKKSSSAKMYGKSPKIEKAPEKGDTVKSEGGAPKEAEKEAKKSAGDPVSRTEHSDVGKSGTEAKGDVMAGTDGIQTHHTESGMREEMKDLHSHHERAMQALHDHHREAMKELNKRHRMTGREAPSAGIEEGSVGESGTQPT